ncbi:MAG: hypothetical protein AB4426_07505 [Xenococcaceae cyanobacterium]
MSNDSKKNLFELRDELLAEIQKYPGVLSVGITKKDGKFVFLVSIEGEKYTAGVPSNFAGYEVEVRDLGRPTAHVARF